MNGRYIIGTLITIPTPIIMPEMINEFRFDVLNAKYRGNNEQATNA